MDKRRRVRSVAALALIGVVVGLALASETQRAASAAPGVWLEPTPQTVQFPNDVVLHITATDLPVGAAFDVLIRFDPNVVHFGSFQIGSFLGSTGRNAQCTNVVTGPDSIQVGCFTIGQTPAAASGSGELGVLTFTPIAGADTVLKLEKAGVTNVLGDGVPVEAHDASVSIVGGPTAVPYATPTSGAVGGSATPSADTTRVPGPTATVAGLLSSQPEGAGALGAGGSSFSGGGGAASASGGGSNAANGGFPVAGTGPVDHGGREWRQPWTWMALLLGGLAVTFLAAGWITRGRAGARGS